MKHYYFLENLPDVYERDEEVDLSIFPQYIPLTEEQITYLQQNPSATRWEIEHHDIQIPELTLEELKQNKIWELEKYDSSPEVNQFFIGEQPLWLDKATRSDLSFSLSMEEKYGRIESTLWYNDTCFTYTIALLKRMLQEIEVYAKDCYNVTAQHKANIRNLATKEEVERYDITSNYPHKIIFNV